jgi:hypothetical protein
MHFNGTPLDAHAIRCIAVTRTLVQDWAENLSTNPTLMHSLFPTDIAKNGNINNKEIWKSMKLRVQRAASKSLRTTQAWFKSFPLKIKALKLTTERIQNTKIFEPEILLHSRTKWPIHMLPGRGPQREGACRTPPTGPKEQSHSESAKCENSEQGILFENRPSSPLYNDWKRATFGREEDERTDHPKDSHSHKISRICQMDCWEPPSPQSSRHLNEQRHSLDFNTGTFQLADNVRGGRHKEENRHIINAYTYVRVESVREGRCRIDDGCRRIRTNQSGQQQTPQEMTIQRNK